jgi:outer membrane cobalamin receptor
MSIKQSMMIKEKRNRRMSNREENTSQGSNNKFMVALVILSTVFSQQIYSQSVSISGYVVDSLTGENLIGVNIYTDDFKNHSTTNNYGYFFITFPINSKLLISYVGFQKKHIDSVKNDSSLVIKMTPNNSIEEVRVYGQTAVRKYSGLHTISAQKIKSLPVIAGETDILKTIQLLPGIQGGIEGTSGFHVRGSSPDQNLILVDGVPVYNVNHLFGVFSVFNTDAINNVQIYKGIFPARYGGRIASVLDITMKEGNNQNFHGSASIGLISSKLLLEGPIKNNKSSYLFTARRTYFDLFSVPMLWLINDKEFTGGYYFYDINAKINHRFNERNRLYISLYTGKDKYYLRGNEEYNDEDGNQYHDKSKSNINWNNITALIRWNKTFNNKHFINYSVSYSKYLLENYEMWSSIKTEDTLKTKTEFEQNQLSTVTDYANTLDGNIFVSNWYNLKCGVKYTFHIFRPGNDLLFITDLDQSLSVDTSLFNDGYKTFEFNSYIENEVKLGIFEANIGLRQTNYVTSAKNYNVFEPRLLLNLNLFKNVTLKGGYSHNYQFIHLLSNSTIGFPTDQWLPVTSTILPVFAEQISAGIEFKRNEYKLSVDFFNKEMDHLLEFKEAAGIKDWEERVTQGKGNAKGIEFYLSKETGKTTGWLAYTYSVSNRQFQELNFGKTFPYKYDRKHDLKIVGIQKIGKKWELSGNWVFTTGYAYTLAMQKYQSAVWLYWDNMFNGYGLSTETEYIENRNNMRMPLYHRLDLSANYTWEKKNRRRHLSFGAYNIYSRLNPIYLEFFNGELYQKSLLPILPYIRYSIDF